MIDVVLNSPHGSLQRSGPHSALVISNGARGSAVRLGVAETLVHFNGLDGVAVIVPAHWLHVEPEPIDEMPEPTQYDVKGES